MYAGVLYYYSFAILIIMVLLNFLIAIITDAYAEIKQEASETTSFPQELWKLNKKWMRAMMSGGRLMTDAAVIPRLRAMLKAMDASDREAGRVPSSPKADGGKDSGGGGGGGGVDSLFDTEEEREIGEVRRCRFDIRLTLG